MTTVSTADPAMAGHGEQNDSPSSPDPIADRDFQAMPLLLVGHGTRDTEGRQTFLDFAAAYAARDRSRPVFPCFLELSEPTIEAGVRACLESGHTEMTVVPLLLFAARHGKFDITAELDRLRSLYPEVSFRYGRHLGVEPLLLDLWHDRLAALDAPERNPAGIAREETVLLFVGRGSSDPDANGDACKVARVLWEGSRYAAVETCFIGITHPRLEEGFRRARFFQPRRIVVLPHFIFTGALVKKIYAVSEEMRQQWGVESPEIVNLPEIGLDERLFALIRDREVEAQWGEVRMNCDACKFRQVVLQQVGASHHHHGDGHHHHPHHGEGHAHGHEAGHHPPHSHDAHSHPHDHHRDGAAAGDAHGILWRDAFAQPATYHERAWQVP